MRLPLALLGYFTFVTLVITLSPFEFAWRQPYVPIGSPAFGTILNVAMFLPIGFLLRSVPRARTRAAWQVVAVGSMLSALIELIQFFLPVIVGGAFPQGARRALRYGNGWIPIAGRAPIEDALRAFKQMAAEAGRDLAEVPVSTFGATEDLDTIRRNGDLGVTRMVVTLNSEKEDKILPVLDRWAELIGKAKAG